MGMRSMCLGCLGLSLAALCQADQKIPAYFVAESFFAASREHDGLYHKLSWLYGEMSIRPDLKLVGSYLDFPQAGGPYRTLDEAFAEWRPRDYVVRMGRLRPRIGFGDWSELMYGPIIHFPLARTQPMGTNAAVPGFSSGFDVLGGTADVQVQAGLVQLRPDRWQIAPRHLDTGVARVQVSVGDAMLGANVMGKLRDSAGSQVGGLDLQWGRDGWLVRGELFRGIGSGPKGSGGHLDVMYRPKSFHRTQLAVRTDQYQSLTGQSSSLLTLGVRQILSKELVATLNYSWGTDAPQTDLLRGWRLRVMTAIRF